MQRHPWNHTEAELLSYQACDSPRCIVQQPLNGLTRSPAGMRCESFISQAHTIDSNAPGSGRPEVQAEVERLSGQYTS